MKTKTQLINYTAYTFSLVFVIIVLNNCTTALSNLLQKHTALAYGEYPVLGFKADITKNHYEYNEQVPEKVILAEMNKLAERFNIDPVKWEKLLRNEASCTEYNYKRHKCTKGELDNKAENPNSTAVGLGQYLILTWYETESWKQFQKARTDYKASLWEMALDLSSGQADKWNESNKVIGIYNYMK